jgi:hypothetical protein
LHFSFSQKQNGGPSQKLFFLSWKFAVYCFNLLLKFKTELTQTAEQNVVVRTVALLLSVLAILGSYLSPENGPLV